MERCSIYVRCSLHVVCTWCTTYIDFLMPSSCVPTANLAGRALGLGISSSGTGLAFWISSPGPSACGSSSSSAWTCMTIPRSWCSGSDSVSVFPGNEVMTSHKLTCGLLGDQCLQDINYVTNWSGRGGGKKVPHSDYVCEIHAYHAQLQYF